jgi:hypothetical protein
MMGDGVTLFQNVLKPNDIVVVIGDESLPSSFLGRYGKVKKCLDVKVVVEFNATVDTSETHKMGALSHTARPKDLLLVRNQEVSFNINYKVKVKLLPPGIAHLKRKRQELNESIRKRGGIPFEEYVPKVDEDGYTSFQMWDLMHNFGHMMSLTSELPFETNIIVVPE